MQTSNHTSYAKTHYPESFLQAELATVLVLYPTVAWCIWSRTSVSSSFPLWSELAEMQVSPNPAKTQKLWSSRQYVQKEKKREWGKEWREERRKKKIRREEGWDRKGSMEARGIYKLNNKLKLNNNKPGSQQRRDLQRCVVVLTWQRDDFWGLLIFETFIRGRQNVWSTQKIQT